MDATRTTATKTATTTNDAAGEIGNGRIVGRRIGPAAIVMAIVASMTLAVGGVPSAGADGRPAVIDLPVGFMPEGIDTRGRMLYAGSLVSGDIWAADRATGEGAILVDAPDGRVAAGLEVDPGRGWLWSAGGPTGLISVYDLDDGSEVANLAVPPTSNPAGVFVNDIKVVGSAAYVTDSFNPVFYRIPIRGHRLGAPEPIALVGEWVQIPGFSANGIETTLDDQALLIINSSTGTLYRVDRWTGVATAVTLDGTPNGEGTIPGGDGMFRSGETLWVVQNRANRVIEIELNDRGTRGTVRDVLSSDAFDVPTTVTRSGNDLYAVNARFGNPDPASIGYQIVRID